MGVLNNGFDDVRVTNGTVQQFEEGVLIHSASDRNRIDHLILDGNYFHVGANGSADTKVEHNHLSGGNGPGISLRFGSTGGYVAHNNVSTDSTDALWGILIFGAVNNRIEHNKGTNYLSGIAVGDTGNVVSHNELFGMGDGIIVGLRARNNLIEHNWIHDNSFYGMRIHESTDNRISFNRLERNGRVGIALDPTPSFGSERNEALT